MEDIWPVTVGSSALNWAAVKELKFSYCYKETLSITAYPYAGSNPAKEYR